MNENNPEESSIVIDLGLSCHYAQLLTTPLRIFSNIPHRSKERHWISLSNIPGHMARSVCRIRCECNIWCFSECLFYYYDTTFSAKAVYMRESGKTGSLNELKTLVKNDNF